MGLPPYRSAALPPRRRHFVFALCSRVGRLSLRWPDRVVACTVALLIAAPVLAQAQHAEQAPTIAGQTTVERSGNSDTTPAAVPATTTDAITASEPAAADSATAELAPILVDADKARTNALPQRSFETSEDVSGFGETIFADSAWRTFESAADLLGESVGAQLRRQGGRDDFATLTIRGAPSAQLQILLDGVSLGRASDSVVNLADIPLDTVERVEMYRGFSPVGLTPRSAAGVVNIITREPTEATGSFAVGGGSFGTAKVNASGAGPLAGGSASAFGAFRTTNGDFDYVDDNGTLDNTDDDRTRKRANNESNAVENLLRWRRGVTDSTGLQLRNHLFYKDEGVPGLARFAPPQASLQTVREIAAAAIGADNGRWNLEQNLTWQQKKLTDYGAFDNTAETTASTTIGRWARPVGKSHWFSGSSEYAWEGFEQRSDLLPSQNADRSTLAIAAGDDWTVKPLDTTMTFQLRHQELWNDSSAATTGSSSDRSTDPRVGLKWEPLAGLAIKSNASTYFRPPTFEELYGADGFTTGNPKLKPESGLTYDAGFEWKTSWDPLGDVALSYSYFGSDIDDVILIILDFNRTAKAVNASRAKIQGHEARVEWKGPLGLAISANFTHQDARNRSNVPGLSGKQLPGLAPNDGWARLSWTHANLVLAYDIDVTGSHYIDSENVNSKLPTRTVQSVSMVYGPIWKGFSVSLEAHNLGNSLVPDEIGYPLPGRAFYATLSWSLPGDEGTRDAH